MIKIVPSPLDVDNTEALRSDIDSMIADVAEALGGNVYTTENNRFGQSQYYAIVLKSEDNEDGDAMTAAWFAWRDDQYSKLEDVPDEEKEADYGTTPLAASWKKIP